jgi:aryl-alcohol dehydrogenase-like predicted oxidoreductase
VESGVFDPLQTSINIADQEAIELTLPLAREKQMGVIAKRPIANAAWKTGHRPVDSYHHEYFERLRKLSYHFLNYDLEKSVSIALRFTLTVPGVHNRDRRHTESGPLERKFALARKRIARQRNFF